MKSNFVVSALYDAWLSNAKTLFAIDPYIVHVLEREGRLGDYDEVQVAPVSRSTREEFIHDHEFVDRKFHKYSEILAQRLDELHGTNYGSSFWRKAFSLSILRHVKFCYDMFAVCEAYFRPEQHDCHVLDQASYHVPVDFDEHRKMFQNTDVGREQLFSIYCGLFYPGLFSTVTVDYKQQIHEVKESKEPVRFQIRLLKSLFEGQLFFKIVRRFKFALVQNLTFLVSPTVGIMESYFSEKNRTKLIFRSLGKIQTIHLIKPILTSETPRWDLRERLVQEDQEFDRFDKFAFACLKHGMPRIFVEDFSSVYTQLNSFFNTYPKLRWIVCEAWIGHTLPAVALAIAKKRGVKHVFNEHNCIAHPFFGNNLKYLYPLVDEFLTLGWYDKTIPNLAKSSSLFEWGNESNNKKEHDLLFISSIPLVQPPEINAGYGESGAANVQGYLKINKKFLGALQASTLNQMVFRPYPIKIAKNFLAWDQGFELREYLVQMKTVDDTTMPGYSRCLMQKSRLVIINYLSTSYLEALRADVPTVILWNKDAYLLDEKYQNFFDELMNVSICHVDPLKAAHFVEKIKHDPEAWWRSPAVRNARNRFVEENLGPPEVLMEQLLERAK